MFIRIIFFIQIIFIYTLLNAQNYELLGPPGGSAIEVKVHKNYPSNIYCTLREGAFFKSADGGLTNEYIESGMKDFNLLEITYDPFDPEIFYFGIELDYYKTSDGGKTWTQIFKHTKIPGSNFYHDIEINPLASNKMYVINGSQEILKSDDGSHTWKLVKEFETNVTEIGISAADTSIIYAASNGFFHKSTNSGKDWQRTYDFGSTNLTIHRMEINQNNPNSIYAWQSRRLIKSNNGGESFTVIKNSVFYFTIDQYDTATVYATTSEGLLKTTDGGISWETLYNGYPRFEYIDINPQNTNELYASSGYYGIHKSTDGGRNWHLTNVSYGQVFHLQISNNPETYFVGTGGTKIQKTTDFGLTWYRPKIEPDNLAKDPAYEFFELDPFNKNYGLLSGVNHLYKTTDGGDLWIETGILDGVYSIQYHLYKEGTVFLGVREGYSTDAGTYRSSDGGVTWDKLLENSFISRVRFNDNDKNLIYYFDYESISRSTDLGNTWNTVSTELNSSKNFYNLSDLRCRANTNSVLYLGQKTIGTGETEGFLAKSLDGGENWFRIDSTLILMQKRMSVSSIWLDESNEHRMIVGMFAHGQPKTENFSSGGLYLTEDDGKTWTELYSGEVNLVDVDNSEPRNILFGTKFGLMKLPDTTKVTSIKQMAVVPEEFDLSQNYPNPFNPSTNISFTLPESGFVEITLYDITGQELKKLFGEQKRSGSYQLSISLSDYPSGIYLYTLKVNNYSQTKKMILLK